MTIIVWELFEMLKEQVCERALMVFRRVILLNYLTYVSVNQIINQMSSTYSFANIVEV